MNAQSVNMATFEAGSRYIVFYYEIRKSFYYIIVRLNYHEWSYGCGLEYIHAF